MRKTLFVSISAMALALGACTAMMSREEYGAQLGAWLGASEETLIRQFGVPSHSEPETANTKVISWDQASVLKQTSGPSPVGGGVTIGVSMTTTYWCNLSFRLVDGVAESYNWNATRDAIFKDEIVDHGTAFPCSVAFPPAPTERERKPWDVMDAWVGMSEAQLRGAYDQEPAIYVLDGDTKFLTWSDAALVTRYEPVPDDSSETSSTRQCAVSFTIIDGIVRTWEWRGDARVQCPEPRPPGVNDGVDTERETP